MDDFERELKEDFLVEAGDLLEQAESAFLRLESERENLELIDEIFRLAHNLKGTSRAVGFEQLSEFTHIAENLILKLKEGEVSVTDNVVSQLLKFKDKVAEIVEGLRQDLDAKFDYGDVAKGLEAALIPEEPQDDLDAVVETAVEEVFEEEPISVEMESAQEEVEDSPIEEGLSFSPAEAVSQPEPKPLSKEVSPAAPQKESGREPANKNESIRVKLSRIDKINNVIGELVLLQTVISQRRYQYIQDELSNKSIGMMNKLFKEAQEISMSLRMVPLKPTFQKMSRIVRDVSKELGKEVNLVLVGEDSEVDKTVLERLSDPLTHIIRNSVDHGIESKKDRIKNGKNPKGEVSLSAFHEGSNLVLQVIDDGAGINPEKVKAKALEKGLIREGAPLSDNEILQLIFHPGLSTKDKVSEISGRGVGMDVVRTNIEALGGEIQLTSEMGKGSSFKVILPLTLAIIEGLVILGGDEKYVLPLSQISEIIQLDESEVESFSGMAPLFKLRGEVLPLFYLNSVLKVKSQEEKTKKTVVIVRMQGFAFGVVVDDIIHQQQIVIKKLGKDVQSQLGIVGSAIMSDGRPALILDLFELFNSNLKKNYRKNLGRGEASA